jgi:hypothetical protein
MPPSIIAGGSLTLDHQPPDRSRIVTVKTVASPMAAIVPGTTCSYPSTWKFLGLAQAPGLTSPRGDIRFRCRHDVKTSAPWQVLARA